MRHAPDQRVTASRICRKSGTNWRGTGPEGPGNNGTAGGIGGSQCGDAMRRRFNPAGADRRGERRRGSDRSTQLAALGMTMVAGVDARYIDPDGTAVEDNGVKELRTTPAHAEEHEREQGTESVHSPGHHVGPILRVGNGPSMPYSTAIVPSPYVESSAGSPVNRHCLARSNDPMLAAADGPRRRPPRTAWRRSAQGFWVTHYRAHGLSLHHPSIAA